MLSKTCEMVFAQRDGAQCQNLAWGYVPECCGVRVCKECAKEMEAEDFKVVRL